MDSSLSWKMLIRNLVASLAPTKMLIRKDPCRTFVHRMLRLFGSQPLSRDARFSHLLPIDISALQSIVSQKEAVITRPSDLDRMNIDWMQKYKGNSSLALAPSTVNELSSIIKYCHTRNLAIVPQGGNTGLVGGGVPHFDEVIISTRHMNKVISFDSVGGQLVAEAGCTLGSLDRHVQGQGFMTPYSFGSKETCVIGGNVATSAGGEP